MRYQWIFMWVILTAAGCVPNNSAMPLLTPSTVTTPQTQASPMPSTLPSPVQPTASNTSTEPNSPTTPTLANSTPAARIPLTATITPGARVTAASSASTLTTGWKTFSNKTWRIAINYPADWALREDSTGASFSAPGGAAIYLTAVSATPGEFNDLPNTRCTTQTNPYGIQARVCLDTIARTYFAYLDEGTTNQPTLTMGMRPPVDLQVFNAMLASVRPAP